MTTIDKLDLSVYNLYALRTTMVEQIQSQLRLDLDSSIPPQTHVLNIYPKMTEMEMLLGVTPMNPPWAFFGPPPKLRKRVVRRSPFAFWRVAPALGSYSEQEEEKEEKEAILGCLKQVTKINGWLGHIVGRLGQFLQG